MKGPDPAFWCAEGYAIVNVDTRGAYTLEGDLLIMGHQEAQDGAEFLTWLSEQPWCNGKVGLTGNSWLALSQWKIGSLRPTGLAALAPWYVLCCLRARAHTLTSNPGKGSKIFIVILFPREGYHRRTSIIQLQVTQSPPHDMFLQVLKRENTDTLASYGKLEDMSGVLRSNPLWNEYWEDKRSKPEHINVPTYVVASRTNPIHTSGTL